MQILVCDGTWIINAGSASCVGNLGAIEADQIPGYGITTEDAVQLKDAALGIFVVVFCLLALKKVAQMR